MIFDNLLYLSRQDMNNLELSFSDMVDSIQALCEGRENDQVHVAPKISLKPDDEHFYMSTLAAVRAPGFVANKSLGLSSNNVKRGIESIGSLITLSDATTGHPVAIMDGDWITAHRTAALSALAARFMARDNSQIAAFVGCGVQAHAHLEGFSAMYPLKEIRILGRGKKNQAALKKRAEALDLHAFIAKDGAAAIIDADLIISTVPDAPEMTPFLNATDVRLGTFVTMVDLARPWIPETLDTFNRIVIDDISQETGSTQPMVNPNWISGDLQDLIARRVTGRLDEFERTAFVFRGMAIGDLALASLAYDKARALNLGMELPR